MRPVLIPTSDVNSEHGIVVAWFAEDRQTVEAHAALVEIETSKAVLEVEAPSAGILLRLASKGEEVSLTAPVALLFTDERELREYEEKQLASQAARGLDAELANRATVKAIRRAEELGVDLSTLDGSRLITVKDVEAAAAAVAEVDCSDLPRPLAAEPGIQRVLLIGGGLGATQVLDILSGHPGQLAVAIVDDDRARWSTSVGEVPVVGGTERIAELFRADAYDAAIVAISTSVRARRKYREACAAVGVPLANAIDRTAKLATDVSIGAGNVICAFCHFGTGSRIGDNNFFSAYNSFDHHSVLADDISTGPGCMASGRVKIGDRVRLGTGIFLEPGVELGDGVEVASGAVILRSVPADHAVKTKVVTTTVVPRRR